MIDVKMIEYFFWLTINLYFEARGEPQDGKVAICHVVLNRAQRRKQTVEEVIRAEKQFSWYNDRIIPAIKEPNQLVPCMSAVFVCFMERLSGKTLYGSDHYFNPSLARPPWAATMARTCMVGNHEFYRS